MKVNTRSRYGMRLMAGKTEADEYFCRKEACSLVDRCPLNMAWRRALNAFYLELDAVSIEALSKKCCK